MMRAQVKKRAAMRQQGDGPTNRRKWAREKKTSYF
jgi:hypothetical protein